MLPNASDAILQDWLATTSRPVKTIVFADLVESVRMMEEHEESTIHRWLHLVGRIERELLPAHGGRLVKSTGDGVMLEFATAIPAIHAALALQAMVREENAQFGVSGVNGVNEPLALRIGAHTSSVFADEHDVYGKGVNLAARLMTLAGPDEIVVSPEVRDQLTADLDADIEDLGESYLKHMTQPMRSYRIGAVGARPIIAAGQSADDELRPTIAVIPFNVGSAAAQSSTEYAVLGDVLADEVIAALSRSTEWRVISRMSTNAFRAREVSLVDISTRLHATYVLTGAVHVVNNRVVLTAELSDSRTEHVVWSKVLRGDVAGILAGEDSLIEELVSDVGFAAMRQELQLVRTNPLPSLHSYTLLLGAIALMHRTQAADFTKAWQILEFLHERHRRSPIPSAWMAKWHVLRVAQGWVTDPAGEASLALAKTREALDADPSCSLALAVAGLVHSNLKKDLVTALQCQNEALAINPSESLAWLWKGIAHSFAGEGAQAFVASEHALKLSPLDPLKYYYDSLAATAALSAGQYPRAIELANRSLKANRTHTSSYRALAISQYFAGQHEAARTAVSALLRFEPKLTVSGFLLRYPGSEMTHSRDYAQALSASGLPMN